MENIVTEETYCLLPLSGPFSLYGNEVLKGLQLGMYLDGAHPGVAPLDLLINVSASPYHRGKTRVRQSIFSSLTSQYGIPFIYVNQVGGQDSLLFDGASLALDGTGKTIARAAHFKEDMVVVDTEQWSGEITTTREPEEVELVHDALVMGIRDYVTKSGFSRAVLGLSGGIDSALTAALAVRALGAENVLGVALPSPYSSKESLEDAEALARGCGCRFEILPIADLFEGYRTSLDGLFAGREEDVTEQNIQARIRGNLLMALSNITGSRRMSSPIKCLNSSGDISPNPLNRVISGLGFSFSMAASRSSSE